MKKLTVVLLFVGNNVLCQVKTNITVTYVDLNIETFFSVSCGYFFAAFDTSGLKKWSPKNSQELDSALILRNNFTISQWPDVDVRAVIDWQVDNKHIRYCFDKFGNFTDGKNIYKNDRLFNFLKRHIPFGIIEY